MKKILVTGASGFIGQSLCETLLKSGRLVLGAVRNLNSTLINKNIKYIYQLEILLLKKIGKIF